MSINNSQQISDIKLMLVKGNEGEGITSIEKTGTSGLVDTYTITFTDGKKTTFTVTNGKGITSIAKTSTSGNVDTYTITYNDGSTSTFTVTNGTDASAIGYDNTTSGLSGDDVQEAIDELADDKIDTDSGTFTDASSNTYTGQTVDMISYDSTNKQLLMKVDGADTVIPFKKGQPINPNHIVSSNYLILFHPNGNAVAQMAFPCSGYHKLYLYGDSYQHTQSEHNSNFGYMKYHWIYDDGTVSADATLLTLVPTIKTWTEISIPQNAVGIYFNCTKTSTGTWIYYSMTV